MLFLVLIPSVSATALSNNWGSFQDTPENEGFLADEDGLFIEGNTTLTCSMGTGMNYQTLTSDFDGDGVNEFVIWDANSIKVYEDDCLIDYELSIPAGTLLSQPDLFNSTHAAFILADDIVYLYS